MRVPVPGLPAVGLAVLMAAGPRPGPGRVGALNGPRGSFRLDATHNPVQDRYVRKYQNGVNQVIATIPPLQE
ncbi:hypothetical protein ABGB18_36290 [Nonomuraea sp. B12E4]|uniref:hypothetical protein n=1 Tax=Nonomuraea sp. B12E4 TaxID=3153564 RepID=UPI00325DCD0F